MRILFAAQGARGLGIPLLLRVVFAGALLSVAAPIELSAGEGELGGDEWKVLWEAAREGLKQVDDFLADATALPDSVEVEIGEQIAKRLNSEFELVNDPRAQKIRVLGRRLARHAKRQGIPYRFNLIQSDTINAYSIAGGHVWVTTSMFDLLEGDEEELAGILGHEIAHVDSRHCIRSIQYQVRIAGVDPEYVDYVRIGYGAYNRTYSQLNELEADTLGAEIVHAARISPWGLVQVMTKFIAMEPTPHEQEDPESVADAIVLVVGFLRTHPPSTERREKLIGFIRNKIGANPGQ